EPFRIFFGQLEPAVLDRHAGRPDRKLHGPAHNLEVLALAVGNVRIGIETGYFRGDLHGMGRGIKTLDGTDSASPIGAGGPKRIFADSVGGDYTQTRNHHSAHNLRLRATRGSRGGPTNLISVRSGYRFLLKLVFKEHA